MRCVNLFLFVFFLAGIIFSCKSDRSSSSGLDIPDEPDGVKSLNLFSNGVAVFPDGTSNALYLDENGCLHGDNLFFSVLGRCDGISYVRRISTSNWSVNSGILYQGEGLVMGNKIHDGAIFTSFYVENIDSVNGGVKLKTLSPFYGDADKFYFNHKKDLILFREAGDTTVIMIKPTTYNVELASGEWLDIIPHITYVRLDFSENTTGKPRIDTLMFSNGVFDDVHIPIVQLQYSLNDSFFSY